MRALPRLLTALLLALAAPAQAQQASLTFDPALGEGPVYVVPVEGMIDGALASYVERALDDAAEADARLVVLHVDTFGGLVDAADLINQELLRAEVPTVAFVDRNAASAGALISLAADRIVMAPGAAIGAATAVDGTGAYATEKVQSYMRSLMRATAEARDRDPRLAEAMVDERIAIPGVVAEGELLSLTTAEALRVGLADAQAGDVAGVLALAGAERAPVVEHRASAAEKVLRFLGSPVIASLLMVMMMGGMYFELQTPGVGFPGLMAVIGAAAFFAPHYLLGLVESWEIVLFVVGIALIMAELFVIPGFGVAGVLGLLLTVGSLLAALLPNVGLQFPDAVGVGQAALTLTAALILVAILIVSLGRYLPRSDRFGRLVLAPQLTAAEGYTSADTDFELVGARGTALTTLRPAGTVEIEGRRIDVVATGTFVPAGTAVEVVSVRGSQVAVKAVPALGPAPAA